MELTRTERLMLANQYRILEKLDPDDAKHYAEARRVVENGFELEYKTLAQNIYDGDEVMSEDECREVLNILQMFDHIHFSYERLEDKQGVSTGTISFQGFDGNNEGKFWSYARHVRDSGVGRFTEIATRDLNSHAPMLDTYRQQLRAWRPHQDDLYLTKEQIQEISVAGYPHRNRRAAQ